MFWRASSIIWESLFLKFVATCKRLYSYMRISRGCKLDLQLISTLVERWRFETHTFHLPCDECTITLEGVALQLSLTIDKPVITGSRIILDKVTLCQSLLRKASNKFEVYAMDAQNRPDVEAIQVEAMNSSTTTRPKGTAQGGHTGE
ncbi:hypothetical protein J1N35_010189 [Gossypium stocksii]|uniref:Aminotransferase-like plant mobile domain-containing protein n=1 Tax=Gossypium stocksii TaxID=47602 RepID=A0A9D3VZW7_9ROSI|nr:hypothetical protein J1N35_010189 [Gossypium stocksii]